MSLIFLDYKHLFLWLPLHRTQLLSQAGSQAASLSSGLAQQVSHAQKNERMNAWGRVMGLVEACGRQENGLPMPSLPNH